METPGYSMLEKGIEMEVKKKAFATRKRVIVAVTSIIVTSLVLTAVLVGIKLVTDSNVEIAKMKRAYEIGGAINVQETDDSERDQVIHYHNVAPDSSETWIIQDFKRKIEIVKVKVAKANTTRCFVRQFDASYDKQHNTLMKLHEQSEPVDLQVFTVNFTASAIPVADRTVAGPAGQQVCDGSYIYEFSPSDQSASVLTSLNNLTDSAGRLVIYSIHQEAAVVDHKSREKRQLSWQTDVDNRGVSHQSFSVSVPLPGGFSCSFSCTVSSDGQTSGSVGVNWGRSGLGAGVSANFDSNKQFSFTGSASAGPVSLSRTWGLDGSRSTSMGYSWPLPSGPSGGSSNRRPPPTRNRGRRSTSGSHADTKWRHHAQ